RIAELPELAKGKGNKIIGVSSAKVADRSEYVVAYAVMNAGQVLVVHSGRQYLKLGMDDLEHYRGERGRRGNKLPRGYQKVDRVEVQEK
ncbi:MAG: DNA topoisomerase IV subunit A, partial [Pseudomonadota bacterium]|nr:DNA topoisomerase IV subunit A [Pseudomonadota bacterium]